MSANSYCTLANMQMKNLQLPKEYALAPFAYSRALARTVAALRARPSETAHLVSMTAPLAVDSSARPLDLALTCRTSWQTGGWIAECLPGFVRRFSDSITRKQTAEVDIIYALESERQVRAEVK